MPGPSDTPRPARGGLFDSAAVERVREADGVWSVPGGELLLPRAFGLCRGVERALTMLEQAVLDARASGKRLFLLGQIIHNPWVNEQFASRGVHICAPGELERLERIVSASDCAIIPAFGVRPEIERRLAEIGCQVIDTSCGNVRRLWQWAQRAVAAGRGVLIFGRPRHDETVVTKSRLAAGGGTYLVVQDLDDVRAFCGLITSRASAERFAETFGPDATNAASTAPLEHLAQVSQTTMLYDDTMAVRELVSEAFRRRFGADGARDRLLFEPTVCRATQDRQSAAVELCSSGLDLTIVVGGFGSSNTRHLFELACQYTPAYFIESAAAIRSAEEVLSFNPARGTEFVADRWLPRRRPLRIGVLSGASTPEALVGEVLDRLAGLLK